MNALGVLECPRLDIPNVLKLGRKVSLLAILLWFILFCLLTNKTNSSVKDETHTQDIQQLS